MSLADTIILALRLFNNRERIMRVLNDTQGLLNDLMPDQQMMRGMTQQPMTPDELRKTVEEIVNARSK